MSKFVKFFVIYILAYFIISTFLVHNNYLGQTYVAISKELLWFGFVLVNMIYYRQHLRSYIFLMYPYYMLFLVIILVWVLVTFFQQGHLDYIYSNMIIWLKYWLLFMAIMISASWLGWVFYSEKYDIKILIRNILNLVIFGLCIGAIRQISKFLWPGFFIKYLWYGPVGDFDFNNPPIYYRTWPWWWPRYNGIFAWPNNLWFLLVWLWSLVIFSKNTFIKNWQKLVYIIVSLLVMSRWLVVWVLFQSLIYLYIYGSQNYRHYMKYIRYASIVVILLFVVLSIYKRWSTMDHISLFIAGFQKFFDNIWWYGLWSSWPAVHWRGNILPENFYIQIMIDFGIIGFLLFLWWWIMYFIKQRKAILWNYIYSLATLWLLWIMLEWLFLHVWEDSMVNYIFMIIYWCLWWYHLIDFHEKTID